MRNQTRLVLAIAAVTVTSLFSYQLLVRDERQTWNWNVWKSEAQLTVNQSNETNQQQSPSRTWSPQVLVVVFTAPNGIERRNALRDTWLSAKWREDYEVIHVFLLGRSAVPVQEKLNEEMALHHDLHIDLQFEDKYEHLSHKMLSMLRMAEERFNNTSVQYILKTDDDTMVNWPLLFDGIRECSRKVSDGHFIAGLVSRNVGPNRQRGNKYYVSKNEFAPDQYPPFAHGPAYIVSLQAVPSLLHATALVPFVHLEDIYLALLAQSANVSIVDPGGFNIWPVKNWQQMHKLRSAHYIPPSDMRKLWQQYLSSLSVTNTTTAATTTTTTAKPADTTICQNCTSINMTASI